MKFTAVTRRLTAEARVVLDPPSDGLHLGRFVAGRVTYVGPEACARDRSGRAVRLYEGDLLVGAWTHRALDEGEGDAPVHLLTTGGLIGFPDGSSAGLPQLELVGSVEDGLGGPLSTGATARMPPRRAIPQIGTIAVVDGDGRGEPVAAAIVNGWTHAGFSVGAGLATGRETGTHRSAMLDAGARAVADFVDFGMPATAVYPAERQALTMLAVRDALVADGAQIVVLQVDGRERTDRTALLGRLASIADAVVVCARDEADARDAVQEMSTLALPLRVLAGTIADEAPTAARVEAWSGIPVRSLRDLSSDAAVGLLAPIGPPS